ncbi:MAG: dethiobiotin synthase [Candidatus Omnitrophica bacterium]|nr:dethiobiotin synthase [Candidatus Omnitrophota bacterium]
MRGIFITGTDTGVGKTIITGFLARYILEKGYSVITQKWIQTGYSSDIKKHLELMGIDKRYVEDYLDLVCPYNLKFPASAHLASRMEHKNIREDKITGSFKALSRRFAFVLVEGLGGVAVPFNKKRLVIDLARELRLSVLVVAGNKLGAINHTLLTIEYLRMRKIKVLGIIFNNTKKEDKRILEDNPRIVKELSKEKILGILPWVDDVDRAYRCFLPIGNNILKRMRHEPMA